MFHNGTVAEFPPVLPLKSFPDRDAELDYVAEVAEARWDMTSAEVATALGIGRSTLYRMLAERKARKEADSAKKA